MDFGGAEAFVVAVVPFDEVGVDDGGRFEATELASVRGADERAGEDFGELETLESAGQLAGVLLASLGEGQVGEAGVLAGDAPGGLGVPGEIDDRKRLAHFFVPTSQQIGSAGSGVGSESSLAGAEGGCQVAGVDKIRKPPMLLL